jgi:hypothetical protein
MNEKVEQVGEALRNECRKVFGSAWSNDVAWRFARVAIEAMREPTEAMIAAALRNNHPRDVETWRTMIDAALGDK